MPAAKDTAFPTEENYPTFEMLFSRYWTRVAVVLARMLGDADEAEDLALEVFYRLYERMDGTGNVVFGEGWLFRVATNLGLNALRARQRRQRYEIDAGLDALKGHQPLSPALEVEKREESQQIREILAEMRPQSAQLLVLRADGLSYRELAQILRLRASAIGTLLNRAERDFERRYRKRFGDRDDETSQ